MKETKDRNYREQNLYDQIEEMQGFIMSVMESQEIDRTEIRYLFDFLAYKDLEEEYNYFRKNAHEVQDENLPFPRLTL